MQGCQQPSHIKRESHAFFPFVQDEIQPSFFND
jgi:hypothetical protein